MENLLFDMHLLEGSLRASGFEYSSEFDKNSYYLALFEKYDISKADFDSCLTWYTKHPKRFERIYANVMTRMEELQADVEKGKFHPQDSISLTGEENLWKDSIQFVFTKDSARNKLFFEIADTNLLYKDFYELSFIHRIAPSDSSINPHAVMYVNYLNGFVDSIYTKTPNDSVKRRYTLKLKAREQLKIKSLSGYLLGSDSAIGKMSATIDSVKLYRRYNQFKQVGIRSEINRIDTTTVQEPDTMVEESSANLTMPDSVDVKKEDTDQIHSKPINRKLDKKTERIEIKKAK